MWKNAKKKLNSKNYTEEKLLYQAKSLKSNFFSTIPKILANFKKRKTMLKISLKISLKFATVKKQQCRIIKWLNV